MANLSNLSPQTQLVGSITNVATAATIADDPIISAPFFAVLTPSADKANEEIVSVTSVTPNAGDFDLVIVRAQGGTTGVSHLDAAVFQHVATAEDFSGKQTIWIPAGAMKETVSNGCAPIAFVETTAGNPDMIVLDFDTAADEHAQFSVAFPKSWDLGTITFRAFWTSTATGTTGVAWGLQGVAVADDGTLDVAYGTGVVVTDDNISAAEDMLVTAESTAVTIAGTPTADELCIFRIYRDVSDANDDMTEDARLMGVKLFFTTDKANDE